MPFVLEETTTQDIDQSHIVRRIDDWADRINTLYDNISAWLPAGWAAHRSGSVRMHEEPMRKFGVAPLDLPVLQLSSESGVSGRLEPRGLWIIGANGRLDFFLGKQHYVIVDAAENLEPPKWQIAPFSDRQELKPLNSSTLGAIL